MAPPAAPFLLHRIRNLVHCALLMGGMLLLFLALGWLLAGVAGLVWLGLLAVVLLAFGPRVSPGVVLRMYRARPLTARGAPFLAEIVEELAARAGLGRPPALFYVPSRVVNAFSVGGRDAAAVGVTDGLLRSLSVRELVAVLAHEIAHVRNNDGWVMTLADFITRIVGTMSWVGQVLLIVNLPLVLAGQAGVSWPFVFLLLFAPILSALLQLALSRSREFEADRTAAELTGDPLGLAAALAKLEGLRGGLFERIFLPGRRVPEPSLVRTHPDTGERIARLRELERGLEAEGWGADPRFRGELALVEEVGPRVVRRPRWHLGGLWH